MIDFIISMTIIAVAALILVPIAYAVVTFGPKIIDNIKGFIRWNRRK